MRVDNRHNGCALISDYRAQPVFNVVVASSSRTIDVVAVYTLSANDWKHRSPWHRVDKPDVLSLFDKLAITENVFVKFSNPGQALVRPQSAGCWAWPVHRGPR